MKRGATLRSNGIPWKGCFDPLSTVDSLIAFGSTQYIKYDWRTRNSTKAANEKGPLTVPVGDGDMGRPIDAIELTDDSGLARYPQPFHPSDPHVYSIGLAACIGQRADGRSEEVLR